MSPFSDIKFNEGNKSSHNGYILTPDNKQRGVDITNEDSGSPFRSLFKISNTKPFAIKLRRDDYSSGDGRERTYSNEIEELTNLQTGCEKYENLSEQLCNSKRKSNRLVTQKSRNFHINMS